ncbi:hypothetical protein [Bradyrhizobium retamae]|uniref:Cell envelope biogenesis protein TolA n=1 Tax=Bradyrhizobium retamae TaxID=1300035 RepID=A0A0R3MNS0_9BRAD|nr:hypothetical protein [Bradyrhizobium retamae]KRR21876.1 hypothetical protein CQ13_07525 [Bradyrhizobium retamae]
MNALVSIDVATLTPATVFAPGGMEGIISKLEAEVRAIDRDISTPEGRDAVKSLAYKVARSKTALDDMGKELVADIKKKAGAVDADRKLARDRLDALKEEVRGPLTAWEDAEAARVEGAERALVFIVTAARCEATPTAEQIGNRIQSVRDVLADHDWQEFRERADAAAADVVPVLERMLAETIQRDADAAELAELRRLKAEREEADRLAAAAEQARQEAEQRAAREAEQAAQAAERERQRQEQAARDQEAAVARAIEQERQKAEREKAAAIEAERRRQEEEAARVAAILAAEKAAAEKRAASVRRRAKVHTEIRAALTCEMIAPHIVDRIIDAIASGDVPHVSITY